MYRNWIIFFVFGIVLSFSKIASAEPYEQAFGNLSEVFEKVIGEKIYVKPGTVHITPEGIFLYCSGKVIPLSKIESDENGVFITGNWPRCPICHFPLSPWGTCLNPNCPTKR